MRRPERRLRFIRLGVAVVSLALGLIAAESAVAHWSPQWTWRRLMKSQARHFALLNVFEPCDYLPFRLRPGASGRMQGVEFDTAWNVNRLGMRGSERMQERTPGVARVVALGDSFTAGHGVEACEAWPAVLETILDRPHRRVEVLNAGYADGYAPDCYYAYLARNLQILCPDVVIVALFAGNDVFEMLHHVYPRTDASGLPLAVLAPTRWVDEEGRRRLSRIDQPWVYRHPVLRDSHLWVMACRAFGGPLQPSASGHSPFRAEYSPAMQEAYDRTVACLDGIRRIAEERGARVVVAIIPDVGQFHGELDYWQEAHSRPKRDLDRPQSLWLRDLKKHGIPAIDLRGAIRAAADAFDGNFWTLYYRHDRHLTREGQAVVAGAVAARVDVLLAEASLRQSRE